MKNNKEARCSFCSNLAGKKTVIICTGNSCRSQMAEGWLRSFDERLEIVSAGVKPELSMNRYAIKVMEEVGIDIKNHFPKSVNDYKDYDFDYIITVCDSAKTNCPVFSSKTARLIHLPFEDPADAKGSDEEIIEVYRRVRDQIRDKFYEFYKDMVGE